MGSFVCVECGCVFQQPKMYIRRHGLETPPYERFTGCPVCGGNYVTSRLCDCCGEIIVNDYIKTNDGHFYCDECYVNMAIDEGDLL